LNGRLRLRAGVGASGRTVLRECWSSYPVQVTRPRATRSEPLEVIVLLQSGGLLDGDEVCMDVHLEPGAQLALRTQAATQIHAGRSSQRLEAIVEHEAAFSYVPRALVPHAQADFASSTVVRLAPGARALCCEVLAPGRVAHGEAFAYSRIALAVDVWCDGRLVARERAVTRPDAATRAVQFGVWSHVATAYVLGDWAPPRVDSLELSPLARGGWFARGLATRAADLDAALDQLAAKFWRTPALQN
jgi:urease accessory protein UreH